MFERGGSPAEYQNWSPKLTTVPEQKPEAKPVSSPREDGGTPTTIIVSAPKRKPRRYNPLKDILAPKTTVPEPPNATYTSDGEVIYRVPVGAGSPRRDNLLKDILAPKPTIPEPKQGYYVKREKLYHPQ